MSDQPTADDLSVSLDGATVAVYKLRGTMEKKFETARRARRRSNLAVVAVAVVFLLGLTTQWRQSTERDHDRTAAAVTNCANANISRQKLVDYTNDRVDKRINSLLDVVFAMSGTSAVSPEQAAQRAVARDKIKADFAAEPADVPPELGPRDCSEQAVTTPTTLTSGR